MKRPSLAWILMICWPYLTLLMTNNYLQVTCYELQVPAMSLMFFRPLTQIYSWLMIWVSEPVGHILTGQMQVQARSTHGLTWTYVQLYPPGPPDSPGGNGPNRGGGNPPNQGPTVPQGKGKIKEPTVFNGDRAKTEKFLDQLFLLFEGRPHNFPTDHSQISTALSYMEGGTVEAWKRAIIQRAREYTPQGHRQGFGTWDAFEQNLRLSFAPINEVDNSLIALSTLDFMKFTSADDFINRFMELAQKAQIWEEASQLAYYRRALPTTIRTRISYSYSVPTTIQEWMSRTFEIDHAYRINKELNGMQGRTRKRETQKQVCATNTEEGERTYH